MNLLCFLFCHFLLISCGFTAFKFLLKAHVGQLSSSDAHQRWWEADISICACEGALILDNCAPSAPYLLRCCLCDTIDPLPWSLKLF